MTQFSPLYEGKAKIIYATADPDILLAAFKDDATAFNAQKRGSIQNKGVMNCAIASHLFRYLAAQGIPNHFIAQVAPNKMHIRRVEIIPLEVVVRNRAAGSLCRQTGLPLGLELNPPLVEFYLKNDDLGDPLLTGDRLRLLQIATDEEVARIKEMALAVNTHLSRFFAECGITLVDFKLEFGRSPTGEILLADEISPDSCRLWNQDESDPEKRILDKDRFRQDLGAIEDAYALVMQRVLAHSVS
ncbi:MULTISPECIES: phosphoribosylaminoimidazolesuccinocarboxamide synthase [unclassified Thermosynechococcus]|uniref:phosphoribosylaminoimidazolesuccinocarboxamide synthase n=1 Tax=unclassified Thermosynechococcus TaxID=2622553 RepID=UPI0026736412|nr:MULTISPECIES: phosphoribosylaminoimidazolesuccinocarboxamide synthase [unclassified Thermosynechococcus]WKT82752.1 phosphoribosylaminoimidazolesuccinocarboxamide synthase [Thermosynechococcus sp. HY596]WNC61879.1 phosphoribosylaminoimidazolesuccinocarboxamide synthase [Thermosynechococcus sp. HY591]WNC64433.1 phosphoribosylaminoimidazolesuccinocarboxamide synthase [Thermosynechococcus sp. HY593]